MASMTATIGRPPVIVHFGENTYEAMRQASIAVAAGEGAVVAQEAAELARDVALTAGPYYANQAAGEAATTTGQEFAVAPGDGTVVWYRRTGGGSTVIFTPILAANGFFAAVSGEVGIRNYNFPPGDVQRYGVFADGVTNWESAQPTYIANIFANSINPLIQVVWPRGFYNTGFNLTPTYNGSRMHFDGAVFSNIVHIIRSGATPVENVTFTGTLSSYDRVGIDTGKNIRLPTIFLLNDATKNPQGTGNRGIHFLASENVTWDYIEVQDTGPTQAALPGAQTIWAAFTIQSQGKSGFTGKVRVKNASGHGAYINALGLNIDIQVDGYGKSAIDFVALQVLEGADSEAQSEQGCGVWVNRGGGRLSVAVDQSNASPADDMYSVLIDETGVSSVVPSRHEPLQIDRLIATVGNGNRGVCIGEGTAASVVANVIFTGDVSIRLRAANTLESGYAAFNVLAPSTASSSYRRVAARNPINLVGFGAVAQFRALTAAGTGVFTELDIAAIQTPDMGAGRFVQCDGSTGVLRGRIGRVTAFISGGSSTLPVIDVDGCENFQIEGGSLRAGSAVTTRAVRFENNFDCSIAIPDIYNLGRVTDGGISLNANTRCQVGPIAMDRASVGNEGIRFVGTHTDCRFQGIVISGMAKGIENGTGMAFTRCSARDCNIAANPLNTDPTDIPVANFPVVNQFNCLNWTE